MKKSELRKLLEKRNRLDVEMSRIDSQLMKHYGPIITEMKVNKDINGLEGLLSECPDSYIQLHVYKTLREVKKFLPKRD